MTPCWYLDSSAIVKLVVREPESAALRQVIRGDWPLVTSELAHTEVRRAVAHLDALTTARAGAVVGAFDQLAVTTAILEAAGRVKLPRLRSLDAIHLASAQCLHHQLEAFITYDARQASAARQLGLTVLSPGATPGDELEDWTP